MNELQRTALRSAIKNLIYQFSNREAEAIGLRSLHGMKWFGLRKSYQWHYQDAVQAECRRSIGKLRDLIYHEALSEDEKQEPPEQSSLIQSAMKTVEYTKQERQPTSIAPTDEENEITNLRSELAREKESRVMYQSIAYGVMNKIDGILGQSASTGQGVNLDTFWVEFDMACDRLRHNSIGEKP